MIPVELMGGRGLDVAKQVPRPLRKVSSADTEKLQRERDKKISKEMGKMSEKRFKKRLKIVKQNIVKELQAEIEDATNGRTASHRRQFGLKGESLQRWSGKGRVVGVKFKY